jgi:type VI secretion system protein ImpH
MAEATRATSPSELLELLCRQARSTSFFQAVLLLERIFPDAPAVGHEGPVTREAIRLRPSIALSCPPADVESIDKLSDERAQVTSTFLGLYGVDSPLPYAYAEHVAVIADEPGGVRLREFLDVFHHRLYSLLYRTWRKSRPVSTAEGHDKLTDRVLAPIGYCHELGVGGARRPRLAEARIRVLRARTTAGLEALLRHRLGYSCPVDPLQERWVEIPLGQRSSVGQRNALLGSSLVVGARMVDCNKVCVQVRARHFSMFEDLLPEGDDRHALDDVVASYLRAPIDYDVEVKLAAEHVPPWKLGQRGALGRTVWLGPPRPDAVVRWRGKPQA